MAKLMRNSNANDSQTQEGTRCIFKLRTKLSKEVDTPGRAKLIKKYFNELRQMIMMDSVEEGHKLIRLIYCDHFFEYTISKHESILYFAVLADGMLRCLLPILRINTWTKLFSKQLLYSDGIAFFMACIRKFHLEPNVTTQCVEVMSVLVDFMIAMKNNNEKTSSKNVKNLAKSLLTPNISEKEALGRSKKSLNQPKLVGSSGHRSFDDFLHQIILHGGATLFPALLVKYVLNSNNNNNNNSRGNSNLMKNEVCIRRLLFINHFIIHSHQSQPELAIRIATTDNCSTLQAILRCMTSHPSDIGTNRTGGISTDLVLAATTLLLGLMASSPVVTECLIQMDALTILSSALVQHLNSFDISVPKSWLTKALDNTLLVRSQIFHDYGIPSADEIEEGTVGGSQGFELEPSLQSLSDSLNSVTRSLQEAVAIRVKHIKNNKIHKENDDSMMELGGGGDGRGDKHMIKTKDNSFSIAQEEKALEDELDRELPYELDYTASSALDREDDSYYLKVSGVPGEAEIAARAKKESVLGRLKFGVLAAHAGADFDPTIMDPKDPPAHPASTTTTTTVPGRNDKKVKKGNKNIKNSNSKDKKGGMIVVDEEKEKGQEGEEILTKVGVVKSIAEKLFIMDGLGPGVHDTEDEVDANQGTTTTSSGAASDTVDSAVSKLNYVERLHVMIMQVQQQQQQS